MMPAARMLSSTGRADRGGDHWIRRLERDAQRNLEPMWLTGRLTPDFKTIDR